MQMIIEEIITNARAVDKQAGLSQEAMQQIIAACVTAVRDLVAKDARIREEQSIEGPWALQPHGDR
ncbi:MAG: hypothetical protein WKG01_09950 [Kofleriaceae bacterium]